MLSKVQITKLLVWRYKHISTKNMTLLLSVTIGITTGVVSVLLKNTTHFIEWFIENSMVYFQSSFYYIFPIIGLLIVYILNKWCFNRFPSFAVPTILHAITRRNGFIKNIKVYYPLFIAPLTVGFGGSVGLLGPAILSGASISSRIATFFHIHRKTRVLLFGCAATAAIAAVFKSPIAGIIFAVEVLSLDLTLISLLPLLLASLSGILTSYLFLGDETLLRFRITESFQIEEFPFFLLLGVGTAFSSIYFTKMYFAIQRIFSVITSRFNRLLVASILIGVLIFTIPPLYGEGFTFINHLLKGNAHLAIIDNPFIFWEDSIWKVIFLLIGITIFKAIAMSLTLQSGGGGGIIIPTLVIGSALGCIVAKLINYFNSGIQVSEANFTLVGMAGLLAGVLHAPLTAIFLIAEISGGYELFVPLMCCVSVSYLVTKHFLDHSIYTRELAEKGQLITHDKDEMVLLMMSIDNYIEKSFIPIKAHDTLENVIYNAVSKSSRNSFPVINEEGKLIGILKLDDIRSVMFDTSYYSKQVLEYMKPITEAIVYEKDGMKKVLRKFQDTSEWTLPVIRDGAYFGFVSKSKLLSAYRRKLINYTR